MSENDKNLPAEKATETTAAADVSKPELTEKSTSVEAAVTEKAEQSNSEQAKAEPSKPEQSKSAQPKVKPAKPTKPRKPVNKTLLVSVLFGLILLLGMAGGGYWLWLQIEQMKADQSAQVAALQQTIRDSENQITQLQGRAQSNSNWQQAVTELEDLVTASAQRWNRQSNRTDQRWPLEEALTLARLAQQRLQLDSSANIAVGLLKAADEVLAAQDQAAVIPMRRQIASDILALESVSAADVNGQFFALQAIADQIQQLEWLPQPTLRADIPEDVSPMQGFWHGLKQIVIVQRLDVPMQAPALQSDFENWRQHTLLLIEQIQLALLARNQVLYETALDQAISQVTTMASQFDVELWQSRFNELKAATLNPNWPDIGASAKAIELYLSEQVQASEQADDSEATE